MQSVTIQTYLALGDSYTIGEAVEPDERWSHQLTSMLRADGISIAEPEIIARTGWTTSELIAAISEKELTQTFDFVTLLIGVNNQYRGQPIETYRNEFSQLADRAIELAGGSKERVVVLSIPDWGVTPFAVDRNVQKIAAEIDAFNSAAKELCTTHGITFIDVTTSSRRAASDASLIASDQLHFSGTMYREWARIVLPVAKRALNK